MKRHFLTVAAILCLNPLANAAPLVCSNNEGDVLSFDENPFSTKASEITAQLTVDGAERALTFARGQYTRPLPENPVMLPGGIPVERPPMTETITYYNVTNDPQVSCTVFSGGASSMIFVNFDARTLSLTCS